MCGIACLISADLQARGDSAPIVDSATQERVLTDLTLRGPDEKSVNQSGPICTFYCRLAVTGAGRSLDQVSQNEHWIVLFNGEVVNFRLLAAKYLDLLEVPVSDTQTILELFTKFGARIPIGDFKGMFALVAVDKKSGRVFASRDPLGIKPLFLGHGPKGTALASTPKTVLDLAGLIPEENPHASASHLLLGGPFWTGNLFQDVMEVESGRLIEVPAEGFGGDVVTDFSDYWAPSQSSGDNDSVLSEYFAADDQVALLLSGGIDSSYLAMLASDYRDQVVCYHLESVETHIAERVASRFGLELRVVKPDVAVFHETHKRLIRNFGVTFSSAHIPGSVAHAVHRDGLKVMLSANGADELFFGYSRTPDFMGRMGRPSLGKGSSVRDQLTHIFREPWRVSSDLPVQDFSLGQLYTALYRPDLAPHAACRVAELDSYVRYDLNPTLDFASMAFSVEARVPFLDQRIVSGALQMGPEELIDPIKGRKAPLVARLAEYLTFVDLIRNKVGFSVFGEAQDIIHRDLRRAANQAAVVWSFAEGSRYHERSEIYLQAAAGSLGLWRKHWRTQ